MAHEIKITLSKDGIRNARKIISDLQKDIKSSEKTINNTIANTCADRMLSYHDSFIDTLEDDAYNHSAITKVIEKDSSSSAIIYGDQIIYDEFGTADVGARDSHPEHSKFGMNAYSSGPYVSTHQDDGGHYWKFNNFKMYGVPAGKFFYNTLMDMKDGEAKKIAKEIVNKTIEKRLGDSR